MQLVVAVPYRALNVVDLARYERGVARALRVHEHPAPKCIVSEFIERPRFEPLRVRVVRRLSRPEILNRIGDNIIVFGFITPEVGVLIFDGMLRNITNRVREEHKIDLVLHDDVREKLRELCIRDLSNGGRGIGNQLESLFVNPLARAMFRIPLEGRTEVTVTDLHEDENRIMTVELA